MSQDNFISLYIHFPWCVEKCPYCDFNSYKATEDVSWDLYIDELIKDLKADLLLDNRKINSIFLGGGTPSLFNAEQIGRAFAVLREEGRLTSDVEITMEANPGALEYSSFKGYKDIGINRISLGVQSFQKDKLKTLGRVHNVEDVFVAVDKIKKAGIENFNIDLMYGLPNQTVEDAVYDIKQAISLNPKHISWYNLTIEPNTFFYKKRPKLPNLDLIINQEETCRKLLETHGYTKYEVSAYGKAGYFCRHNINYWKFGDYFGVGAGAHGKIKNKRYQKFKYPKDYLKKENKLAQKELILKEQMIFQYMLNHLRLEEAIDYMDFERKTGISREELKRILNNYRKKEDVFIDSQNGLQLTSKGKTFLDDVVEIFL